VPVEGMIFESHDGSDCRGSITGIALEREARSRGAARVEVFIFKRLLKEIADVVEEDEENLQ
jgi:hypothetical protein